VSLGSPLVLRPKLSKDDACMHECPAFLNLCQQVRVLHNERYPNRSATAGGDSKTTTSLQREVARRRVYLRNTSNATNEQTFRTLFQQAVPH
jgi:hypothetical protein